MNIIDIVLVIILVVAGINGFVKGLFVELASIASLFLGIWAAVEFSGLVQHWLSKYFDWSADILHVASFIFIFIFVVILIHLVATLAEKFVKAIALSIFSRLAGAVVGIIKSAFILSILMLVILKIENFTRPIIPAKTKSESKLYAPIENIAPGILPFLKAVKPKEPENQSGNALTSYFDF